MLTIYPTIFLTPMARNQVFRVVFFLFISFAPIVISIVFSLLMQKSLLRLNLIWSFKFLEKIKSLSTLSTTLFRCPLRLTFLNMLNSVKNQIKRKRLQSPLSTILTTIFRCQLWCEVSRQKSNNYVIFSAKRVINIQNSP